MRVITTTTTTTTTQSGGAVPSVTSIVMHVQPLPSSEQGHSTYIYVQYTHHIRSDSVVVVVSTLADNHRAHPPYFSFFFSTIQYRGRLLTDAIIDNLRNYDVIML